MYKLDLVLEAFEFLGDEFPGSGGGIDWNKAFESAQDSDFPHKQWIMEELYELYTNWPRHDD